MPHFLSQLQWSEMSLHLMQIVGSWQTDKSHMVQDQVFVSVNTNLLASFFLFKRENIREQSGHRHPLSISKISVIVRIVDGRIRLPTVPIFPSAPIFSSVFYVEGRPGCKLSSMSSGRSWKHLNLWKNVASNKHSLLYTSFNKR